MADKIHVVGVTGGQVKNSNVAGVVHGGMGNTTTNRHSDRTIHNTGNIGNVAAGDHHTGQMTSTFGSAGGQKALADVTVDDVLCMVHKHNLGQYESMFRDKGIDGSLFLKLTEEHLCRFGVDDDWDRERILNLKKFLPK